MYVDASDGSGGGATGSGAGAMTGSSSNESVTTGSSSGGVVASPRGKKRKREGETATTPTKKGDSGDGVSPSKRKKVECKFGPKCYQKSRQHREQFLHPWVSQQAAHNRARRRLSQLDRDHHS